MSTAPITDEEIAEQFASEYYHHLESGGVMGDGKLKTLFIAAITQAKDECTVPAAAEELGIKDAPSESVEAVLRNAFERLREINHDLWAEEGTQWRHNLHREAEQLLKQLLGKLEAWAVSKNKKDLGEKEA